MVGVGRVDDPLLRGGAIQASSLFTYNYQLSILISSTSAPRAANMVSAPEARLTNMDILGIFAYLGILLSTSTT